MIFSRLTAKFVNQRQPWLWGFSNGLLTLLSSATYCQPWIDIYIYIYIGSNDNLPWSLIWSLVRPDQSFTFAKKQSGPFAIDATPKIIGISRRRRRRRHHHHPHPHPRHRDLPTSQHWDIKTWASTLTAQEQLRFRLLNATGSSPKMAAGWIQSMPQLLRKFNTVSVQKSSHSKREPHRNHASTIRNCFCAASAISAARVSRSKRVSILLTHLGRCGTRWQVGPGCLPDGLPQAVLCLSLLRILTSVQVSYLHSEKYMRNWKQTQITSERSTTLQMTFLQHHSHRHHCLPPSGQHSLLENLLAHLRGVGLDQIHDLLAEWASDGRSKGKLSWKCWNQMESVVSNGLWHLRRWCSGGSGDSRVCICVSVSICQTVELFRRYEYRYPSQNMNSCSLRRSNTDLILHLARCRTCKNWPWKIESELHKQLQLFWRECPGSHNLAAKSALFCDWESSVAAISSA